MTEANFDLAQAEKALRTLTRREPSHV